MGETKRERERERERERVKKREREKREEILTHVFFYLIYYIAIK